MTGNAHVTILTFKKDSYIIVEGKEDSRFFIIQEGKVQLSREAEVVKERDGNIFGPGEFFGVVAAMSSHSHIETAQALTDVTLMMVQASHFDAFIQSNTLMARNIITQFSNRMRYLTKALTQLTLNDSTAGEDVSHLFTLGKYYDKIENFSHAYYAYRQYLKYCPAGEYAPEAQERLNAVLPYAKSAPFIANGNKRTYGKDTILYAQGEPGEELYVIQSGSVKITKIINGNEILLAVLKAGDFVGEMGILESKPRSVTAVTHEESTLIAISKENFTGIVSSNPQIIGCLIKSLAERIWFLYKHLANTLLVDPVARVYDALLIQAEKNNVPLESNEGYTFDCGLQELIALTGGMSEEDADKASQKIALDPHIEIMDNKIRITQVAAITKERDYYKSVEWRKKAFHDSAK
jgi:CRP-like cAMP-binding protein